MAICASLRQGSAGVCRGEPTRGSIHKIILSGIAALAPTSAFKCPSAGIWQRDAQPAAAKPVQALRVRRPVLNGLLEVTVDAARGYEVIELPSQLVDASPGPVRAYFRRVRLTARRLSDVELFSAGLLAGVASELVKVIVLHPLDTLKTRLQTREPLPADERRQAFVSSARWPAWGPTGGRSEGGKGRGTGVSWGRRLSLLIRRRRFRGPLNALAMFGMDFRAVEIQNLYAGLTPALISAAPQAGALFGTRELVRRYIGERVAAGEMDEMAAALMAALAASVVYWVVRAPTEVIKQSQQAARPPTSGDVTPVAYPSGCAGRGTREWMEGRREGRRGVGRQRGRAKEREGGREGVGGGSSRQAMTRRGRVGEGGNSFGWGGLGEGGGRGGDSATRGGATLVPTAPPPPPTTALRTPAALWLGVRAVPACLLGDLPAVVGRAVGYAAAKPVLLAAAAGAAQFDGSPGVSAAGGAIKAASIGGGVAGSVVGGLGGAAGVGGVGISGGGGGGALAYEVLSVSSEVAVAVCVACVVALATTPLDVVRTRAIALLVDEAAAAPGCEDRAALRGGARAPPAAGEKTGAGQERGVRAHRGSGRAVLAAPRVPAEARGSDGGGGMTQPSGGGTMILRAVAELREEGKRSGGAAYFAGAMPRLLWNGVCVGGTTPLRLLGYFWCATGSSWSCLTRPRADPIWVEPRRCSTVLSLCVAEV